MSLGALGWVALSVILFWSSFGFWACLLLPLCILATFLGVVFMGYLMEYRVQLESCSESVPPSIPGSRCNRGLPQITPAILNPPQKHQYSRYLTGHKAIDGPLSEVLHYILRDYVYTWYRNLSNDEAFIDHIRDLVHEIIVNFSSRAKGVDWAQYLTIQLVDDFASHLRLFRQAQMKLKIMKEDDPSKNADLLTLFFSLETAMERSLCRDLVCISKEREIEYLQQVSDVLLYLLLPPDDFHNKIMRIFVRELLVNTILLPVINLVSDPDYINQTIVWMCRNSAPTSDEFLTVLKCTDNISELEAVKEIVAHEIAVQRSRDAGGDDDTVIKKQLNSLHYLMKVVENRLQRLNDGSVDTDSTGLPSQIDWKKMTAPGVELFQLPFEVVLGNNIALSYFIDFLTSNGSQKYVAFYLHAEGYKVSAQQLLSQVHTTEDRNANLDCLREAAQHIYDTYLSEKASSRIVLEEQLVKKLLLKLRVEPPDEFWFDDIQKKVAQILQEEQYFPNFMKTDAYIKLLAELDLLKDLGSKSDEEDSFSGTKSAGSGDDCGSLNSLDQEEDPIEFLGKEVTAAVPEPHEQLPLKEPEVFLSATIYTIGIARESNATFAVYAISVIRYGSQMDEERWCTYRRYSDFDDFHIAMLEKFPKLSRLLFPGKKTFNNLSHQFLEQRKEQLNRFLKRVLNPEILSAHPGLCEMALNFLQPGPYEKGKKQFARTMGALVNPLRSSVRTMGNMVKNAPENIFDGLRESIVKVMRSRPTATSVEVLLEENSKVGAAIDTETQDNIPLRIMLLLMDEVFDLKSKNQWLRRRIVVILRQIIKATFGDTINRKIVDYVEWMASAEKIAEYISALKQALWPNGCPAQPQPERDVNTRMRTRVAAKMIMLCSLTDELKHIIGSDTTRRGMLCVFEMFQHGALNRRLAYVLLEGFLATLFPKNRFNELFRKMHGPSPSISTASISSDPTRSNQTTPDLGKRLEVR